MVDYNAPPAAPAPANTWMSTTGGILSIIVGVMDLIGCLFMGFFTCAGAVFTGDDLFDSSFPAAFFGFIAFYLLIIGILSLIGGIFAVRRKIWGLALTGAIAAFFGGSLLGIIAIVFVIMSKKEFSS
jgi:hypothetical protein